MEVRATFFCDVLSKHEDDYLFTARTVFSDEATFHTNHADSGKGSSYDMLSQQERSSTSEFSECLVS